MKTELSYEQAAERITSLEVLELHCTGYNGWMKVKAKVKGTAQPFVITYDSMFGWLEDEFEDDYYYSTMPGEAQLEDMPEAEVASLRHDYLRNMCHEVAEAIFENEGDLEQLINELRAAGAKL